MSDEFTFYWGAACGSARAALRQLQEPNVAINYATQLNKPWEGIDRLFIDSGGYSFMLGKGDYQTSDSAYLDYVAEHEPELFALRDYPCEPDILGQYGRTVEEHQVMTCDRHENLLEEYRERDIDAEPLAVIQGWKPEEYRDHIDALHWRGVLTEHVAIGTLCGRNDAEQIRDIVLACRDVLGDAHKIHGFGVKLDAFKEPATVAALDTADSNAFDADERRSRTRGGDTRGRTWQDVAFYYLKHKRKLRDRLPSADQPDPEWLRDPCQSGLDELSVPDGGVLEGEVRGGRD